MEEDSQKDFFCEKCVLQFDTKNIFDIHMETHKVQEREMGPKAKTCGICLAVFAGTRGTSILREVRNVEIPGPTQQLLNGKSHDFLAVFPLCSTLENEK